MSERVLKLLKSRFGEAITEVHSFRGDDTAVVRRDSIREVCRFLKENPETAFDMPIDVTCVDFLAYPTEAGYSRKSEIDYQRPGFPKPWEDRFVVVYHLRSMKHNHRVRLKVSVPEADLRVDSVTDVWKGVNWFEREVFDMFGITFEGHPNLRRILLYPEFVGHPLRKDYPLKGYQPRFDMPGLKGDPVPSAGSRAHEEEL